ncbi:hypothetical protein SAMN05444064_11126 [Pseudomonas syringae]|nr:hypothetical protein SAMN05444514_12726 [Pseudomonas syringae]SFM20177.1 hypothetical protein SAMN05444064_11126 [Pseudomonas syringae]
MNKDVSRRLRDLKSRRWGNSNAIEMDSETASSKLISEKPESRSSGQWVR